MLGQLAEATRHVSPLAPSRVQLVAELTGQALTLALNTPSTTIACQLRTPATAALPLSPTHGPRSPRHHADNLSPKPFPVFPVGAGRVFPSLAVSSPTSSPRGQSVAEPAGRGAGRRPRRRDLLDLDCTPATVTCQPVERERSMDEPVRWVTKAEAAEELEVSPSTLDRRIR